MGNANGQLPFHGQLNFVDDSEFVRFKIQYYLKTVFENISI